MRYIRGFRMMCGTMALLLSLCTPARAGGLFDWLTGNTDPTPTPEALPALATVTLPPAEIVLPEDAATAEPSATPALIPVAAILDDGMIRVELRSLELPAQLNLTLAGVYAVDGDPGFRFARDTRVALSQADGKVYLSAGGLTIDMGQSVTLTRHAAGEGEENGIYIDESEKRTLYCGDLSVYAETEGLRAVLKLPVEDYLYGVVAYEMSDSFPLEALKAQAVAARTYAMQRKWQAGKKDHDLVDTTADQVFKGFDPDYANVIRAVDETRGVVGLWDGRFAVCYYTASNGGQTALPSQLWGTSDSDGYLAVTDDPFDLENPKSLQNELTVGARCEGSAALKAMLEAALGAELAKRGFGDGEWELDSIAAIEPVNPLAEGSRMFQDLAFDLRVKLLLPVETPTPEPTDTPVPTETPVPEESAEPADAPASMESAEPADVPASMESAEPTDAASAQPQASATPESARDASLELAAAFKGEAQPTVFDAPLPTPAEPPMEWVLSDETVRVTLDVYDQIKRELGLGLNGSDCELITVETQRDLDGTATAFTLVMRRFGHGMGMSQRGAQWMAGHYGMSWREIFAFYYPGLSVERMEWTWEGLSDLEALPDSVGAARPRPTATPTPAPLPALKAGEHIARVTATTLNVRERPTTAARAIDQLARGREVIVSSEPDADGWVSIRTAELEGYVKAEYLEAK